jgi:hypothetical protein
LARILAFVPDLLFGSNVLGALQAAGHDARLTPDLGAADLTGVDLVVVDLTAEPEKRIGAAGSALQAAPKTLAFYSHVEAEVRRQASEAGFDLVVPRSRMAREGASLAQELLEQDS